jgi:hypothetical protein
VRPGRTAHFFVNFSFSSFYFSYAYPWSFKLTYKKIS